MMARASFSPYGLSVRPSLEMGVFAVVTKSGDWEGIVPDSPERPYTWAPKHHVKTEAKVRARQLQAKEHWES